jgi:hypothetical protein
MSDDVLKIVPTDCEYVPNIESHQKAIELLESILPDGEMCQVNVYENIEFIDQGENLDTVICPNCKTKSELDIYDEHNPVRVVIDRMEESFSKTQPIEAIIEMPCCNNCIPVHTIEFDWPAAFAKSELSIWNPNIKDNLSNDDLGKFEELFGCKLKQIRAYY